MRNLFMLLVATGCALPDNPPVTQEIAWVDQETEDLARRACYDCHSNETVWLPVHRLPIIHGIVVGDVERGRCHMNFSTWDLGNEDAWDAPDELLDGDMPLPFYVQHHEEADLTDAERRRLAEGLRATFELDPPKDGEPCEGADDDDDRDRDDDDDRKEDRRGVRTEPTDGTGATGDSF